MMSDSDRSPAGDRLPAFPSTEVQVVAFLVLVHLALVFWSSGPFSSDHDAIRQGGLLRGGTLNEPWRLVSSLFLHSGVSHALWNGLSTLVFGVPLLTRLGFGRSCAIYFASGIGGGIAALWFSEPGTLIIGSSGAVAGLFGAWVVLTLRQARRETLSRRAMFRTMGIAMLVLPSLIRPATASGHPISISSHMGGLLTGMLIGAILSVGMVPAVEEDEDEPESVDGF